MSEADKFDAEVADGSDGTSETVAEGFNADDVSVDVGGWGWLKKVVSAAEQVGVAYMQTSQGEVPATGDALKKAGEMVLGARGGDQSLQDKIKAIAALADRGDPAAKQAAGVLEMMNNLAKKQEAKAPAAAAVGGEFDAASINSDLDVDAYDWGW